MIFKQWKFLHFTKVEKLIFFFFSIITCLIFNFLESCIKKKKKRKRICQYTKQNEKKNRKFRCFSCRVHLRFRHMLNDLAFKILSIISCTILCKYTYAQDNIIKKNFIQLSAYWLDLVLRWYINYESLPGYIIHSYIF